MNYLIYGSKDFALILKDMLDYHGLPFAGFIDDFATGEHIVGTFEQVQEHFTCSNYVIALGVGYNNLAARWEIFQKIKSAGYEIATLIHQSAYVRDRKNVGEGSIIMAHATLDCNAVIEEAVVMWPGVVVNHDSRIGRNTFLSPSATVCGFVNIGEHSFVGASAVIVDHRNVPPQSFVKAHSLFKS